MLAADSLQAVAEKRIAIKDSLLNASRAEADLQATLYMIEIEKANDRAKTARKKAVRNGLIAIAEAVVIILLIL